jgi:hypothetical protein
MKQRYLFLLLPFFTISLFSQYTQTEIDAFLNATTGTNSVGTEIIGNARYFYTNNYPDHPEGNINGGFTISATGSTWAMCAHPRLGGSITQLYSDTEANSLGCTNTYNFGVAINGIKFGPSSAAFFEDDDGLEVQDWHLEALYFDSLNSDGDANDNIYGAHSTSGGLYHYHGEPKGYFAETVASGGLGIDGSAHSTIVGYAADGYPIYYKYGYANSDGTGGIVTLDSGYQLKTGNRGGDGLTAPDGTYDGEYIEDYEFTVATKLDECNGRFGVTPEYPKGTYYYVITESWPVIPRCFAGAVLDNSFLIGIPAACGDSNAAADCSDEVTTSNSFTWTGETNSDWDTVSNWIDDEAPTTSGYVSIPDVSGESNNFPVIANNTEVVDVIIYPSAELSVNSGKSLTLSSDLTNNGKLTINSDATSSASLLISGDSAGDITYNRYLSSSATSNEGWHLVSSPVIGETEDDIITNGSLLTNSSSLYSIATYNNSYVSSAWDYQNASANGTLDSGKGYSIKRNGSGTISFVGTYKATNLKDYAISEGTKNSWNLIGNPYPSFIAANNTASATANFLTANSSELDASYVAIYVWNSSTKSYDVINHAMGTAEYIAPGQGFFVYSKSGGGVVDIRQTMQSHQESDLFLRKSRNTTPTINLSITDGSLVKTTTIKYIDGTTTSLDLGYDAGVFSGTKTDFNVFSHLISNSDGTDFALQSLPLDNYENMIIPIGLKVVSGTEITFTVESLNLTSGINVYLEDKVKGEITKFDKENAEYTLTLDEDQTTVGRFYLHTTSSVLNAEENSLTNVSMYNTEGNILIIIGLQNKAAVVEVYDVLGKKIINKIFTGTSSVNEISLGEIVSSGVYIVKLNTEGSSVTKKIIIN